MPISLIKPIFTFIFTLFGSLLGSFSNVVILRMATGTSVVFPPSSCPKCQHQLSALDLFPVFSWVFLGGKCRYCKTKISIQYPLVEGVIASLVGISFYKSLFSTQLIPLAASSVIWFIVSVIYLRKEVDKPAPFIWSGLYILALGFWGKLFSLTLPNALAALTLAIVCGAISTIKNSKSNFFKWFALSFIYGLFILQYSPYLALPMIICSISCAIFPDNSKVRIALFAIQLFGIYLNLYLK
jgi:prepilin signal peptidase PulO-like enzyme (type II secretory pathway)